VIRRSISYSADRLSRIIMKAIPEVGVKNVLFETDFPHPTCLCPDPVAHSAKVLGASTLLGSKGPHAGQCCRASTSRANNSTPPEVPK